MSTPATRTPIKLARGSYTNLYASIDDLQEGEIVYAEDQNQLYVKEGSQLIDVTGDGGGGGGSTNLSYTTSGAGLSVVSSSGSNTNLPAATTDAWGLMTDEDKTKLDGITASANNYSISSDLLDEDNLASDSATKVPSQQSVKAYVDATSGGSNLSNTANGTSLTVESSSGNNTALPAATTSAWGVMTDEDKTKLDGVAASANNYTHPNHSGEVTSTNDGATVIASNIVDEDNLKISNSPSDGKFLQYKDGTDELTWAVPTDTNTTYSVGDGGLTQNNFTNTLKTKLDGIEASATADQTNAEIRAAVEAATDSNVFTDDDHTKLNGITASANNYSHPTSAGNVHIPSGGSSGQFLKYDSAGTAVWAADNDTTYSVGDGGLTQNNFTNTLKTKLDGIEASADVTDATNVNSAGAVMNSDLDGKGELLVGDGSGDPTALAVGTNNYVLTADSGEATGVKWAATATGTPEGTAVISTGETGTTKFLRVDGDGSCSWQVPPDTNTQVSIDDTPVNGVTDEAISSNWAFDHNAATGNSAHVPAAGSSGQFLKHDATWGTPPDTNTQLTEEQVEDFVGGMVTGNTETGITVTYQDADGTLDFAVAAQTPEGTAILSTGETGGSKFLREDGDGTCSWQTVSGGGGSGDIEGVTAGTGLTGGGTSGTVTVNADVGIADDKLVQIDDADAADDDYAKFTSSGIEGRSYAEVKTDLSLNNVENTAVSTWAGSANITTLGTVSTVTSTAVATPGVRKIHASSSAPGGGDGAVGDIWVKY
tara:strand:+ start:4571 stop:6874 length:2304 start_codon:yes stop_codon:yes gene_type:complete